MEVRRIPRSRSRWRFALLGITSATFATLALPWDGRAVANMAPDVALHRLRTEDVGEDAAACVVVLLRHSRDYLDALHVVAATHTPAGVQARIALAQIHDLSRSNR